MLPQNTADATGAAAVQSVRYALCALRAGLAVRVTAGDTHYDFIAAELNLQNEPHEQAASLASPLPALAWVADSPHTTAILSAESGQSASSHSSAPLTQSPANAAQQGALELLRKAQLLPVAHTLAPLSATSASPPLLTIETAWIAAYTQAEQHQLQLVTRAALPNKYCENTQLRVFRSPHNGREHLALLVGQTEHMQPTPATAPLVRIHSSCLTGDLLGSLRCDCGDQLDLALRQMAQEAAPENTTSDYGILCYLNQEGRGIGLANKIRAYSLQEQGQDTVQANESLGFAADERHFGLAATMLQQLGIQQIRLLTNNPAKVQAMESLGIKVIERVPLIAPPTTHNESYLATKAQKCGHVL